MKNESHSVGKIVYMYTLEFEQTGVCDQTVLVIPKYSLKVLRKNYIYFKV